MNTIADVIKFLEHLNPNLKVMHEDSNGDISPLCIIPFPLNMVDKEIVLFTSVDEKES